MRSWLLACAVTTAVSCGAAFAATPPPGAPDVLVLIVSEGGPKDRISFTYRGPVGSEQARRDLAALAKELGQPTPKATITTEGITTDAKGPRMTSVETAFAGLVDRKHGRLHLEPHARAFRRLSRMRVTYFVFGPFQPGSPMATAPSDGLQLSVRAEPPVFTFDLWRSNDAVASTGRGGPSLGLLALPILAAIGAGIAAFFAARAWSGRRAPARAKRGEGRPPFGQGPVRRAAEPADPLLAGTSRRAKEAGLPRPTATRTGDES